MARVQSRPLAFHAADSGKIPKILMDPGALPGMMPGMNAEPGVNPDHQ